MTHPNGRRQLHPALCKCLYSTRSVLVNMNISPWVQGRAHAVEKKISIAHIAHMKAAKLKNKSACPVSSHFCSSAMSKAVCLSWLLPTTLRRHRRSAEEGGILWSHLKWQSSVAAQGLLALQTNRECSYKKQSKATPWKFCEVELTLLNWGNSCCSNVCILTQSIRQKWIPSLALF